MPQSDRLEKRIVAETRLFLAEAKMKQLQYEMYDLRQQLNETTPIIYNIPADVIVEIFRDLIQIEEVTGFPEHDTREKPIQFVLGGVCRTWRGIVWNFQSLWKRINFTYSEKNGDSQLELVQEWLLRSGGFPLDLSFTLNASEHSDVLDRVLRVFLFECTRWRTFAVRGTASKQLRREMDEGEYAFPMLSSIVLGIHSDQSPFAADEQAFPWTFNTDNSLQKLTIQNGPIWKKQDLHLNWTSIAEFTYTGSEESCAELLPAMAESLRTLHICCDDAFEYPDIINFPILQNLSIGWKGSSPSEPTFFEHLVLGSLLDKAETNSLRYLSLHLTLHSELPILTNSIARSQCSLLELTLTNLGPVMEDLTDLLRGSPTLEKLSLEVTPGDQNNGLTDQFLDALIPPDPCLPNLLEMTYTGRLNFQHQKLLSFLQARSEIDQHSYIIKQLQTFTVHCRNPKWVSSSSIKPNLLRDFYYEISRLKSVGTLFDITYADNIREGRPAAVAQ